MFGMDACWHDLCTRLIGSLHDGDACDDRSCPTTSAELLASAPKRMTMIYLLRSSTKEVLLGHKARGFGAGNWNAFGGKVEYSQDESLASSAARELAEESGLEFPRGGDDLEHVGVILFRYPQQADASKEYNEVHLFAVDIDRTAPVSINALTESEEMTPIQWFHIDNVPLEKMWCDDKYWLKPLLFGLLDAWTCAERTFRIACFFHFFGMSRIDYFSILTQTPSIVEADSPHSGEFSISRALSALGAQYVRRRKANLEGE